ncbi:MAG TPA: helix-turn-helix domain-containing protein [Bacteroidales bacterium]
MYSKPDIGLIQRIVGPVSKEQIRFIDSFVFENVGIFLPVAGPCYYALSPEHTHPSYMVIYSFKGEGDGWVSGIKPTTLKPGEFLFMAPGIKHQEKERSDTPRYLAICIMPELFEPIAKEYNIPLETLRSAIKTAKALKQFLPLCWQFLAEVNTLYQPNKSLIEAISVQMCHSIIRSIFQTQRKTNKCEWRTEIGQSIAFIHSHLHNKMGVADIASAANMSVPNFCRVFKKEMGQTPIEYLSEQRLHKAQSMLLSDEFSMQDITTSCGFSSVSYLSTSFKKRYQISPEKYKLQMITK